MASVFTEDVLVPAAETATNVADLLSGKSANEATAVIALIAGYLIECLHVDRDTVIKAIDAVLFVAKHDVDEGGDYLAGLEIDDALVNDTFKPWDVVRVGLGLGRDPGKKGSM